MKNKKFLKILIGIFSVVAILIIASGIYQKWFLPNIKVKDLEVKVTPEHVERGKYLANHVLVCVDCHSKRDWTKYSGPIVPGTEGMGVRFLIKKWDCRANMLQQILPRIIWQTGQMGKFTVQLLQVLGKEIILFSQ